MIQRTGIIQIKKRTVPEWLVLLLFIMPYMKAFMTELLSLPSVVIYTADIAWVAVFLFLVFRKRGNILQVKTLLIFSFVFFLYAFISYLFHFQSMLFFLWGVRNNFRFYVAFACFGLLLDESDKEGLLKLVDKLFWLNAIVVVCQYVLFSIKQDNLGGIFGTASGCNGYLNIFLLVITVKAILWYLNKKEKLWQVLAKCGTCFLIAALAELKFFFVEFIIVVVLAVLLTGFSWRKLGIVIISIVGISLGVMLLVQVFPEYADFFSLEQMFRVATSEQGYTNSGDLNRLTAIAELQDMFFPKLPDKLFGFGLGNCDTASYAFLSTPFFEVYSDLHYSWMSTAYIFLELGYVGIVFFFGFFVMCFAVITKMMKQNQCNKLHGNLARIMAILCCVIAVYNSSLRTEAGYMAYFILALPFADIAKSK